MPKATPRQQWLQVALCETPLFKDKIENMAERPFRLRASEIKIWAGSQENLPAHLVQSVRSSISLEVESESKSNGLSHNHEWVERSNCDRIYRSLFLILVIQFLASEQEGFANSQLVVGTGSKCVKGAYSC